jgi:hypothetical protein
MEFVVDFDRDAGMTFVEARAEHYDAYPHVGRMNLGHVPQALDPDLEALMCALLFHDSIGDDLRCSRPCSPLAEHALSQLMCRRIRVANVDPEPRPTRVGDRCAILDDGSLAARALWCLRPPDAIRVRALADNQSGDQAGSHEISVITSLGLLGLTDEITRHRWTIALAALIASDYGIRVLCLPSTFFSLWFRENGRCLRTGEPLSRAESTRRALDNFGLKLAFPLAHLTDAGVLDVIASNMVLEEWEKSEFAPRILEDPPDDAFFVRMLSALGSGRAGDLVSELGRERVGMALSRCADHQRHLIADAIKISDESLPHWIAIDQLRALAEDVPSGWSRDRLGDAMTPAPDSLCGGFAPKIEKKIKDARKKSLRYAAELRRELHRPQR